MALTQNFEGETERELKDNRSKEKYEHITIYYPEDFSELIPITKETLDWAIRKNEEVFGTVEVKPVDIIVFQEEEEMNKFSNLIDISGFYSDFDRVLGISYYDKELILDKKETPLYYFQSSILHEYTHYIFQRMIEKAPNGSASYPVWFHEGMAEYIGNDGTIVEFSDFQIVPFSQLSTGEQWQEARLQEGTNVYEQSYFSIKYLVDEFGLGVVKKIIDSTNNTGDFEESLLDITGLNILDLENNFLTSYQ